MAPGKATGPAGWPETAPALPGHEPVPDREAHQVRVGFETERLHERVLVVGHGPGRQVEAGSDLLHAEPFGQKLKHLTLAGRELAEVALKIPRGTENIARDERRDVRLSPHGCVDGGPE